MKPTPPPRELLAPGPHALPFAYRWLRAQGVADLRPWFFLNSRGEALRDEFLREVAPPNPTRIRDIAPFATRLDRDDVAAFVVERGAVTDRVCVVHLTW